MKFLKELLANKRKLDEASHEMSLKEVHESFPSSSRGPIHEDRRLQIEELDEWWTHKPKTPDKPNLRQNELNTFPNQLKVRDRVLLDAADPHIVATTPNEEIPLTGLSIFPFGTVEVPCRLHEERKPPYLLPRNGRERHLLQLADVNRALLTTDPWELFFGIIELAYLELSVPEFSTELGLYMEEFKEVNELYALTCHIHFSPLKCWHTLAHGAASYNPSSSKASILPPSLRYLHAILSHTITGSTRRSGIGRGSSPSAPYMTRFARHFGLLDTAAQESSLTLIGHMSPQGISSMLSMRRIEKSQGTYPPQYHLGQSTEEEAYEDIHDDVPPQHEDPPTQQPPPSRLVHAAASYADISKYLTRLKQQCFQRFDNIDVTLQQICQHLHISSPIPPREPSSDEDV
ncbi:hypothetical protein GOBAR_AA09601 [Gossypium barbadense]|uniref:Uncharacterized protein n=1 Tax=Gossypium barbadense TaxID=3634 RepID=A0A2P5Y616_GOSBA|nr:hypothetical protein GOBAR_AA09601 [Gossypium barbadense]